MTTQTHKWLPSEPTAEMYTAYCSFQQLSLSIDSYKAMWQAAPVVEQEPAVYLVWHDGEFTYTKHPEEIKNAYETLPLYTNPQPQSKPLSVAELDELWKASYKEHDGGEKAFQNRKRRLKRFARAIEKAHGIGV